MKRSATTTATAQLLLPLLVCAASATAARLSPTYGGLQASAVPVH